MKKITLVLFTVFFCFGVFAQETVDPKPWKFSGITSISLNQANFSNWSAGGVNSVSWKAFTKLYLNHQKDKFYWNNTGNFIYGMQSNEGEGTRKNEDVIDISTRVGYEASKKLSYSFMAQLVTQFDKGYNYPNDSVYVSKLFAPGVLTAGFGITYKPYDYLSIIISPATSKTTIVNDQGLADAGAFGVEPAVKDTSGNIITSGKKSKFQFGAYAEAYFKQEVAKNVNYESKISLFYNYLNDAQRPSDSFPLDMSWENFINLKVNKFISANIFMHFLYMPADVFVGLKDSAGNPINKKNNKIQLKETFGIGLAYNF